MRCSSVNALCKRGPVGYVYVVAAIAFVAYKFGPCAVTSKLDASSLHIAE